MITEFLSNRTNLTIFQCILYYIIGYIMGEYLSWGELVLMFIVLFGIQFITRIKGVTDGMLFRQIMMDSKVEANEVIRMIKRQQDKINKKDLN
tara:strand:- start:48 stop:326 length:279 start_codon:yes stop_codon:yes gene_type:complete